MKGVFFMQKNFMIGISSRALFDLEEENAIFESQGVEAYVDYQIAHEKIVRTRHSSFFTRSNIMGWISRGQP